jgi:hypothetical protein
MLVLRFGQLARLLPVAVLTAAAMFAFAVPAKADVIPSTGSAHVAQAKRGTASLTNAGSGGATQGQSITGFANGFQFIPGAPGMNIGGRVNVGKSKLYVPYYGNISTDPTHPGVQGTAGIAYGFRTWDISVLNGGFGTPPQAPIPGVDAPKVNPALSLSIRF